MMRKTFFFIYIVAMGCNMGFSQTWAELLHGNSEKTWVASEIMINGKKYEPPNSECMYQTEQTFYSDGKTKNYNACLDTIKYGVFKILNGKLIINNDTAQIISITEEQIRTETYSFPYYKENDNPEFSTTLAPLLSKKIKIETTLVKKLN